jgi:TRAP transporter, DctM subunit
MAHGGISDRLIKLADACIGWMRGGLAMVNILASFFFGGISGSATADTASLGAILIPMMNKQGYDPEFSTAITMTSSVQGMLIPPSHNMIIYAMAAGGLSVSALFMAGIVPGMVLGLALMIFSFYLSVKRKYPKGKPFSFKYFIKSLWESIWGLGTVLIVVFGVVTGAFTPTESAAIACLYSVVVSVFVYKEMKWRDFIPVLKNSIKVLSTVLILIAASGPFGFCITYLQIPDMVVNAILGLTTNKFLLLLLINLIILALGMILGMASIIIIVTPILLPILVSIGMSPIQFGAILILNCGIGLITPPVGGVLFVGSGLSGISIEKLSKHTWPFLVVMFICLLLITYIPSITLALPHAMGLL